MCQQQHTEARTPECAKYLQAASLAIYIYNVHNAKYEDLLTAMDMNRIRFKLIERI